MSDEMPKEKLDEMQFVKKPLSEKEMNTKLDELRTSVTTKMDKWANKVVVGQYNPTPVERKEGDTWEANGKQWVRKNGVNQTNSPLQDARMPWHCPKCSKSMNHRFDRKFYNMRGHCYDCNINFEHELRVTGKWEEFERRTLRSRQKSVIKDTILEYDTYLKEFKAPTLYFENGEFEVLAEKSQFKQLFLEIAIDRAILLRRLEEIEAEEASEEALGVDNA
jgi:hypothetical protein